MDTKMRCGHEVDDTDCFMDGDEVFVQFTCVKGCKTHWQYIGDVPYAKEVDILDTKIIDKK